MLSSPGWPTRLEDDSSEAAVHSHQTAFVVSLPAQIGLKQTYDASLISSFIHAFHPNGVSVLGSHHPWLIRCADLLGGAVDNALAISLRCLALARCARSWKDDNFLQQSRTIYGKALMTLQAELNHDSTKYSEQVMAACRILSTYEFLESASDGVRGWITHLQGLERVVFLRGPSRFRSSLKSGALTDWRGNVVSGPPTT